MRGLEHDLPGPGWRIASSGGAGGGTASTLARGMLLAVLVTYALMGWLAAVARAEGCLNQRARAEGGWTRLPDCRAYELVSPAEKNGNQAGAAQGSPGYSIASPEGGGLLYNQTGPFGATMTGVQEYSVARRTLTGWSSTAVLPRSRGRVDFAADQLEAFNPSADLSHVIFVPNGASFAPGNPSELSSESVYVAGQEGLLTWVGEPKIPSPIPALGHVARGGLDLAGGSADLSVAYFTYYGTLVPEDEAPKKEDSRAYHVREGPHQSPWGFYEWRGGQLSNAGELPPDSPNGRFDPYGAVPAAIGHQGAPNTPEEFDNEVSVDGSRAFFVSPDPAYCEKFSVCDTDPPELYVRETLADGIHRTALVTRSLITGHLSEHGPVAIQPPHFGAGFPSYVFASPDGSQAFFESVDPLTLQAKEAEEDGSIKAGSSKEYDFNVATGALTFLSGVADGQGGVAAVLASSEDGSRFMFAKESEKEGGEVPTELDLWSNGGVARIAQLSTGVVDPVRATSDGSVFVFETASPIVSPSRGAFNNGGGDDQIYRYEVASKNLSCVSCPPAGVAPSGDASLSLDSDQSDWAPVGSSHLVATRGMSADGNRVFFDTPEALVPQAVNGKVNVYEWEGGRVFLISAGSGPEDSFLLDNSESGDDVFFATTDGLVPADADGGYDVYDARAPHEPNEAVGFPPLVSPAPCVGDCQGPPSVPPALGVLPASAAFSGAGNPTPVVVKPVKPKPKKKVRSRKRGRRASVRRRGSVSRRGGGGVRRR